VAKIMIHELPSPVQPDRRFNEPEFESVNLSHLLDWGRLVLPENISVVLPFSGGLDSATLAAYLTQLVGPHNVIAIHGAHSTTQPQETENAYAVAEQLGIHFIPIDLHKLQTSMSLSVNEILSQLGQENEGLETTSNASIVYAVTREVARGVNGRLCGTLDGAEILTGYFPKESFYGDFLPLGGLLRQEVRALSQSFNLSQLPEQFAVVPGCGSIVEYVNSQAGTSFRSEAELDIELLLFLNNKSTNDLLRNFLFRVNHKSLSALGGRPIYYPSKERQELLRNNSF